MLKTQCGKSSVDALKSVQLSLEDLQFLSTRCLMENAVEGEIFTILVLLNVNVVSCLYITSV